MKVLVVLRAFFGTIFVLFIPGFAWSFMFFRKDEIDWIERIALSFGLSIALVPLTIFWLNYLFKIKINAFNCSIAIFVLIFIPIIYLLLKKTISHSKNASKKNKVANGKGPPFPKNS